MTPTFDPIDLDMWFLKLEGYFVASNIITDNVKYVVVLSALDNKSARDMWDIFENLPANEQNKYQYIKENIKRLGTSQDAKIIQLLEQEELSDRKPTQYLRHLHIGRRIVSSRYIKNNTAEATTARSAENTKRVPRLRNDRTSRYGRQNRRKSSPKIGRSIDHH